MEQVDGMYEDLLSRYPSFHNTIYKNHGTETSLHNQPLLKRIGDYLNDNYPNNQIPIISPLETTYFRDLNPAFVVMIHPDNVIMLEPGNVGPLSQPLVNELLYCINNCMITMELYNSLWAEHGLLYEGGLIIGIVDYRLRGKEERTISSATRKREASLMEKSASVNVNVGSGVVGAGSEMLGEASFPPLPNEMHKIWLKPCQQAIIQEIRTRGKNIRESLELEKKYLEWSNPHIITDPNPLMFPLRSLVHFNCHAMEWVYSGIEQKKKSMIDGGSNGSRSTIRMSRDFSINNFSKEGGRRSFASKDGYKFKNSMIPMLFYPKGDKGKTRNIVRIIQELRAKKSRQESESFHGLDAKKDPVKAKLIGVELNFNWIMSRLLWRTIRYERESSLLSQSQQSQSLSAPFQKSFPSSSFRKTYYPVNHYTVHIFYHPMPTGMGASSGITSPPFEVLIRWGSIPCTAINGDMLVRWMPSKAIVEHFLESFRLLMTLEGIICISDVSNPVVLTMGIVNPSSMGTGKVVKKK